MLPYLPLKEIYNDLGSPTAKSIGGALGAVADLICVPVLAICRQNVEAFCKILGVKIENIPEKFRQEPKSDIAVPIFNKAFYTSEKELREMYANLLAASVDTRCSEKVLPRYAEIVSNLSPADAKILQLIGSSNYWIKLISSDLEIDRIIGDTIRGLKNVQDFREHPNNIFENSGLPFIEVRRFIKKDTWIRMHKIFTDKEKILPEKSVTEIEVHLELLNSLGLIEIENDIFFPPSEAYNHLIQHEDIKILESDLKSGETLDILKGKIYLTQLGENFLSIARKNE